MAIHHISRRVNRLSARLERRRSSHPAPRLSGGGPWICTWQCELCVWPDLTRFSNQMLRYQRRPEGLVHGLPAHRAMQDAYVTAHHLRELSNSASIERFLQSSTEPGLLRRVPFRPDRGESWDRLRMDALQDYLRDRNADLRFDAQTELARRGEDGQANTDKPAPFRKHVELLCYSVLLIPVICRQRQNMRAFAYQAMAARRHCWHSSCSDGCLARKNARNKWAYQMKRRPRKPFASRKTG